MLNLVIASGVFVLGVLLLRFQGKLPAKGTPTAAHLLRPYCLHALIARYHRLDKRLHTTNGGSPMLIHQSEFIQTNAVVVQ